MKNIISVIIVDYGTLTESIEYANHISSKIKENSRVIVVDVYEHYLNSKYHCIKYDYIKYNGKKIRVEKVINQKIDIFIIRLNVNVGFARGNNIGFKFCVDNFKDEYVVFSNNDIEIPKQICMTNVENYFNLNERCCIYGPRIIDNNGYPQGPFERGNMVDYLFFMEINRTIKNFYRIFKHKLLGKIDYPISGNYFTIQGCFIITNIHRFESVGLFDENTFLYREEEILGERIRNNGFTCHYDADISVIHRENGTISKEILPVKSKKLLFESACYYFLQYRHTSEIIINMAKWNFKYVYIPFYSVTGRLWKKIKQLML